MKKYFISPALLMLILIASSGCATNPLNVGDFFGMSVTDLEKAKDRGMAEEFDMPKQEAFDRILAICEANKLAVYQKNFDKGYIVVINFPKQTDTTRVGVFFSEAGPGKTLVTLSSLSSTALERAGGIFFGGMKEAAK